MKSAFAIFICLRQACSSRQITNAMSAAVIYSVSSKGIEREADVGLDFFDMISYKVLKCGESSINPPLQSSIKSSMNTPAANRRPDYYRDDRQEVYILNFRMMLYRLSHVFYSFVQQVLFKRKTAVGRSDSGEGYR